MSEKPHTAARPVTDGPDASLAGPDMATAGHPLTVADVLTLPVLSAGQPQVVTGADLLDRAVRWVHMTELTDPASFLKGGELVLTTGMPLPEEPAGVRRYVNELADIGAAALVIELVRRYHRPPDALVHACEARGLPLVTLAKDVNFLEVTQVVHALILGNQAEEMRRTQRIHEAFTALTLRGAVPEEVVRAAAEMSGHTVVLENLAHQALICAPSAGTVEAALSDWERRSRATPPVGRTSVSGPGGWLVTSVEYQGESWGRVVMLPASSRPLTPSAFDPTAVTVLERAAMALTIARVIHAVPWERAAHRDLLRDLVGQRHHSPADADARVAALGLPTKDCGFVAVLADLPQETDATKCEVLLCEELRKQGTQALVGALGPTRLGILLPLRPGRPCPPVVEQLSRTVLGLAPGAIVSAGSEAAGLFDVARSFREAIRVTEATEPGQPLPPGRSYHKPSDIGLRRMLFALREDTRIQDFTERRLSRLLDHDARHGTDLLTTLRHYLDAAGNKTLAARSGSLSRETVYQRLRSIERILDCDLESGEHRTELHVALTALDVLRAR
ncbi:PucR family transcriptional regulator [Streptomyces griseorubiginosus]|uniref:PucR family transcriptional regulator n=1 Tax=Streptomyces griseorubiginosus TaxID=67304 RepID=UPI002E7FC742|nr:PucR family transcriptional regulator ligand-binding domain-containing protein [Streptomyces griseorubiginosus]WUB49532.1 PucR family transcriptional regulator ligand-binding domain-containing protein [Streptomyces griseorubiginosus]WUB58061.1 PucR family transcriptional regulator ligand-binding domain-containing protein [Streptomyces griseorubiginosus]